MLSIQYPVCKASVLLDLPKKELDKIVPIVEGVKELDAIAPVNHVTGSRQNVLDLLDIVLSPERKDLLQRFLSNVASDPSMTALSDEQMLELLPERLSTGMPAEDALFAKQLASVADLALPAIRSMMSSVMPVEKPVSAEVPAEAE